MRSFMKSENSDELDFKILMKELESEDSSQIYQIHIENAESQDNTAQVEISKSYCNLAEVFSGSKTNSLFLHCKQNHVIDLIDGQILSFDSIYNFSEKKLTELQRYLNENLKNDFIQFLQSFAETLMLFAFKLNDKLQLCVNYCELNAVTAKNHYSLLLIEKIMNCINGAKIFTKIDIKNVYYWIWIHKDDKWKTVFHTQYELYEYLMMFFELINASATFQSYIHKILCKYLDIFVIIFLNDILIYFKNENKHEQHVCTVLEAFLKTEFYMKLSKCQFSVKRVFFVRFIIINEKVKIKKDYIITIFNWSELKNIFEIQSFIDFANFYKRFIKNFFCIAAELTSMLKSSKNVSKKKLISQISEFLISETASSFCKLIWIFTTALFLRHFNPKREIQVETDISEFVILSILTQRHNNWRSVVYYSQKMTFTERNYRTNDEELLAIIENVCHWWHYLEETRHTIEIFIDHDNLHQIMKSFHKLL